MKGLAASNSSSVLILAWFKPSLPLGYTSPPPFPALLFSPALRMTKILIASYRLVRFGLYLVHGLAVITWRFPKLTEAQRAETIQAWAQKLLGQLAIKLIVNGKPTERGPMLVAANHISWLDIPLLLAAGHCRFVAKAEIQHWPLLGKMAHGGGTIFIARESRRDAMRVVHQMAEHLRAGDILAIFPEGTTSDGQQLLPFHANLFQAAISACAPVQPVALGFVDAATGQPSQAPCYIGDDTLLDSIWRTLTAPPLCATVTLGEPQLPGDRDRRALAADVREAVQALR